MQDGQLQDAISRGLGRAAMAIGDWCSAYRPADADAPLQGKNRFLKLRAAFAPANASFAQPVQYGSAAWQGLFDAAYTRPGDYIVRPECRPGAGDGGVWFIAAQQRLMPVLCVRADRTVQASRPTGAVLPGLNGYGGATKATVTPLFAGWPASVLSYRGAGMDRAALPGDVPPGSWTVLLPAVPGVVLRTGDLFEDDLGRAGVVAEAEFSELGWRLSVRQAAA